MTGRFSDGYDWLQAGYSVTTISNLLQARGYYLRGSAPGALHASSVVTGRWGYGLRLRVQDAYSGFGWQAAIRPIGSQNSAGGFVSAGLNMGGDAGGYPFLAVYDLVNDVVLCSVMFAPNGVAKAYRGLPAPLGGTLLGASDVWTFYNNTDIDVEVFIKVHDTAGSINNTWLGTCRSQFSLPASAGANTNFSKSNPSFANWQNAINLNVDDTLYVYDPTVGDYDLYGIQPLINSPTVFWVQVTAFVRQDDATQRFYKNRISSSGTIADGASYATSQTYSGDSDVFELNPHTSLTFTGAQVNALEIGPYVYA